MSHAWYLERKYSSKLLINFQPVRGDVHDARAVKWKVGW